MGLLSRSQTWLADRFAEREGVSVTYARPGGATVALVAVPAGVEAESQQPTAPARFEFTSREYRVRAADFAATGLGVPVSGDRITETVGGVAVTFVVRPKGGPEPAWRWADPERTTLVIHTKVG